jgi:hypothetical protein
MQLLRNSARTGKKDCDRKPDESRTQEGEPPRVQPFGGRLRRMSKV